MDNPFEGEIIETSDGSHTLKLKGYDEQYHSMNGALQESQHVFLQSGLGALVPLPFPVHILEVGFGTGLNALITSFEAINRNTTIYYDAIEPYPLSDEIINKLNYARQFTEPHSEETFRLIHLAGEEVYENIGGLFFIRCFHTKIQELALLPDKYHLVYFDAFGPDTQPEMWTEKVFEKIYLSMKPNAVLVTYCVKGAVRRAMKAAGFEVQKIPGPRGKREMSRAFKRI